MSTELALSIMIIIIIIVVKLHNKCSVINSIMYDSTYINEIIYQCKYQYVDVIYIFKYFFLY